MRTMTLLITSLLSFTAYAGFDDNYDQVAIVLAKPDDSLRKPVKEFYLKTYGEFSKQKKWSIANQDQFYRALRNGDGRSTLIPTISRPELIASLEKPSGGDKVIGNLQRALDTLAIKGAVIVDCEVDPSYMIRSCALHYYDRAKTKVYASVSKNFLIPVSDASVWARPLTANLQEGMASRAREEEQMKVDRLLAETEENGLGKKRLALIATASSERLQSGKYGSKSHLVGTIAPVITKEQSSVGVEGGLGKTSEADVISQSKHIGLLVNTYVRAMEHARWDLSFAAGGAERFVEIKDEGRVQQRSAYARIEPGFGWELLDNMAAGVSFRYTKFFGGSNTTTGSLDGAKLANSSMGFGINLRYEF